MQVKLSNRLASVAKLVLPGKSAADIGTDHGYLAVHLVISDICPSVIATDYSRGPLEAASQLVGLLSLDRQIDLRLGEGLKVLKVGEATTICIAGMGGFTIRDILSAAPDILSKTQRLVLQPQRNAMALRKYLADNGWRIVAEDIALDSGFYYEIMAAEKGQMSLNDTEAEFGPLLLSQPHPLLEQYLSLKLTDMEALIGRLSDKTSPDAQERLKLLTSSAGHLRQVLAGLAK